MPLALFIKRKEKKQCYSNFTSWNEWRRKKRVKIITRVFCILIEIITSTVLVVHHCRCPPCSTVLFVHFRSENSLFVKVCYLPICITFHAFCCSRCRSNGAHVYLCVYWKVSVTKRSFISLKHTNYTDNKNIEKNNLKYHRFRYHCALSKMTKNRNNNNNSSSSSNELTCKLHTLNFLFDDMCIGCTNVTRYVYKYMCFIKCNSIIIESATDDIGKVRDVENEQHNWLGFGILKSVLRISKWYFVQIN